MAVFNFLATDVNFLGLMYNFLLQVVCGGHIYSCILLCFVGLGLLNLSRDNIMEHLWILNGWSEKNKLHTSYNLGMCIF